MSIESVMPSDHLILCHPLLLVPSILLSISHSVMSDSLRPHEPQHTRPPVHHQLLKFTQTPVHWVGDAIQPSYHLSSPSPPGLNLSQHQGLFQWVSSSHQSYGFSSSHVQTWELDHKEGWALKNWCFQTSGAGEDFWESLGLQGDQISQS